MRVVVLVEALLGDGVDLLETLHLLVPLFLRLRVRVHVVAEHERAHVLLDQSATRLTAVRQVLEHVVNRVFEVFLDQVTYSLEEPRAILVVDETVVEYAHHLVRPQPAETTPNLCMRNP